MTARFVNGVRVLADQDALSPLKAAHGQAVYWKQIRWLLLENGTETYGCVHDDFTHPEAQKVLIHLRECANKPVKPKKQAPQADRAFPDVAEATTPAGLPRTPPQVRFEPPLPTFNVVDPPARTPSRPGLSTTAGRPTNAGPARPAAARYQRGVNAGPTAPATRPAPQEDEHEPIAPVSPAPAARTSAVSRDQVLKRLALVDQLEKENQRLLEWGNNWKRRAQAAEAELNAWDAAISGAKVRRNARRNP